jgi:hypothetical protein
MKYIFIPYLFNVINIHILHYKLSQTSNSLTAKSQSGHSLRDGGSSFVTDPLIPDWLRPVSQFSLLMFDMVCFILSQVGGMIEVCCLAELTMIG